MNNQLNCKLLGLTGVFGLWLGLLPSVLAQTTIFFDNFDESSTFGPAWMASPNLTGSDGVVEIVGLNASSSPNAARLGKTTDGGFTTNALDLHIDLSGQTQVGLEFDLRNFAEETHPEDGIFFSDDGGSTFTLVYTFDLGSWCNSYGRIPDFDVDQLAADAGLVLNNQFVIRFQQYDNANFSTVGDEDGFYLDNIHVFVPNTTYFPIPYFTDFNDGVLDSCWAWRQPVQTEPNPIPYPNQTTTITNNGSYGLGTTVGLDNSFGVFMGSRCDGAYHTNALDLHLDLAGQSQVALEFWFADFADDTQNWDGLYFSDNGGMSFVKVFDLDPTSYCGGFGAFPTLDVDELAHSFNLSLNSQFIIRFQQHDNANFNTTNDEDGFYLDNVRVFIPDTSYAAIPFEDDFNSGVPKSNWHWNAAFETAPDSLVNGYSTITNTGSFGISTTAGTNNTPAIFMGKRCDGVFHTNALDLYLDLDGHHQVALEFWFRDFADETQQWDGLYFSDDGGASFVKVINFDPINYCGSLSQFPTLDVDELAFSAGLSLTGQFIIRFQQYDNANFSTLNDEDGFYIDDVKVYVPDTTYAPLPFEDDFNGGIPKVNWHWNAAFETAPDSLVNGYTTITNNGRYEVSTTAGVDNTPTVLIGKTCDGTFHTNALDLNLDLSGQDQVWLELWFRDYGDETQNWDSLYFSDDGGLNFRGVLPLLPGNWSGNWGDLPPIDVDFYAKKAGLSLTDNFVVRIQQYDNADFNNNGDEDGLYIDNVRAYAGEVATYALPPYYNGFESGQLSSEWQFRSHQARTQTALDSSFAQLTRFWQAEVTTSDAFVYEGNYGFSLGKSRDNDGVNLNAYDLHLNLAGTPQAELSYWIKRFFDEYDVGYDGIWLSVDAGETFFPIWDFDYANLPNNTWTQQTIDLVAAATTYGLALSDSTVIRFQQYGSGNFSTSGDEDGLMFDDISVSCQPPVADFSFEVDCSTLEVAFSDSSQGTNSTTPYAWDFEGDGVIDTISNGDIIFTYSSTGTFDVTLFVGNAGGCSDSTTKQVFIGSSVPPPVVTPGGPTLDLCQGDTLLLSAAIGYQGYAWNTGATTQTLEVTTPGIYSVRGLGIDGCFSIPTTIEVIERPSPPAPFISLVGEPQFCEGDSAQLVAPFGAASYLWNTGDTTQTLTVRVSGTYSVQLTNTFGCLSPAADTTITVDIRPAKPTISQSSGSNILTSSSTGTTYRWFLDGMELDVDAQAIDAALYGSGTYTVQVINGECESELSDPLTVTLTSITEAWMGTLSIAPNPSNGHFTLISPQTAIKSVALYDLAGRRLPAEISYSRHESQVRSDYRGLVILKVQTDRGIWVQKLLMN